jgi:hypothetical protein
MAEPTADEIVGRQPKQFRGGVIAESDGPAVVHGYDAVSRCRQCCPDHVIRACCVDLGWIVPVAVGGRAGEITH